VQASHKVSAVFDDPNLIGSAGLVPVMRLAERAGLHELLEQHLSVASPNAGRRPCLSLRLRRATTTRRHRPRSTTQPPTPSSCSARSAGPRSPGPAASATAPTPAAKPPGPAATPTHPPKPFSPKLSGAATRPSTPAPAARPATTPNSGATTATSPCTRVGLGGLCPHCDEPVALADLLDTTETTQTR